MADQARALEMARMDAESLRSRLTQALDQLGDMMARQVKVDDELETLRGKLAATETALASKRERSRKVRSLVRRQRRPA